MILELDCGNTFIKWRLVEGLQSVKGRGAVLSSADGLPSNFEGAQFQSVSHVLISSVVKSASVYSLEQYFSSSLGEGRVYVAEPLSVLAGVEFAYKKISKLGVDRCLAMVAAHRRFPGGVLVLDCGSAITADFVDSSGQHLGGYILPGINLIKRGLIKGTSDIRVDHEAGAGLALGKSTEECVGNGACMMAVAAIERTVEMAGEKGLKSFCITGGDAVFLNEKLDTPPIYIEDLVFEGLEIVSPFF